MLSCILLIGSCSTPEVAKVVSPPSEFSLLDNAHPDNGDAYLSKMETYDTILKASPVPIYLLTSEEFASELFLKISRNNILGLYFYGQTFEDYPSEFIFINNELTPEQIMVTYFHELGHYNHRKSKCIACVENPITREQHAIYNELKMGWEYDLPDVLESSVRTMAMYIVGKNSNISYRMATFEVMKTDLWKQTLAYLKSKEGK